MWFSKNSQGTRKWNKSLYESMSSNTIQRSPHLHLWKNDTASVCKIRWLKAFLTKKDVLTSIDPGSVASFHPCGAPGILVQRVEPKSCLRVLTKRHCALCAVGGLVIRELRMWRIWHLRRKATINTRHCWAPACSEQLWWTGGEMMTVQVTWSPTPGKSQVADWHDNLI